MRRLVAIIVGLVAAASVHAEGVTWQSDYDKAVAAAKKDGKLVLVDVYTDWCGFCKKLDQDVYANPKVAERLARGFITVKINPEMSSRAAQVAEQFHTPGFPYIVFMNGDGRKIGDIAGYVPASEFLKRLDQVANNK